MNRFEQWKAAIPYGVWTCSDGRQVIHNRMYWPILERPPGQPPKAASPGEWIHNIVKRDYLFDDGCPPWHHSRTIARATLARCNALLADWGLPTLPKKPKHPAGRAGALSPRLNPLQWHAPGSIPPRRNPWENLPMNGKVRIRG
jgi:hypothetical protein